MADYKKQGASVKITVIKDGKRKTFKTVEAAKKFAAGGEEVTVIVT